MLSRGDAEWPIIKRETPKISPCGAEVVKSFLDFLNFRHLKT